MSADVSHVIAAFKEYTSPVAPGAAADVDRRLSSEEKHSKVTRSNRIVPASDHFDNYIAPILVHTIASLPLVTTM